MLLDSLENMNLRRVELSMNNAQRAFNKLVSSDLEKASFDDVKTVALAMWYDNFVPQVGNLSANDAKTAGYVVDKLMRFNCVPQDTKEKLMEFVQQQKSSLQTLSDSLQGSSKDKLAVSWGLCSDLRQQVKDLLPLQTRHYVY